jgi:hypothetical protein
VAVYSALHRTNSVRNWPALFANNSAAKPDGAGEAINDIDNRGFAASGSAYSSVSAADQKPARIAEIPMIIAEIGPTLIDHSLADRPSMLA